MTETEEVRMKPYPDSAGSGGSSTDRQPRRGVPFGRAARERCVASGRAAPARSLALRRVAA
ncbi:MAG: hypothetical protein ACYCR4_06745, partial [Acidimicrobiales bacterium]